MKKTKAKEDREKAEEREGRSDRFIEIVNKLKKAGLKQKDICQLTGIIQPRMSQLEHGMVPTLEHMGLIVTLGIKEGVIDVED